MPKAHIQKFLAAIEKEANSWSEWGPIKPLTEEEIAKIKSDPKLRRRILRSRAAYRDKNRGQGNETQMSHRCPWTLRSRPRNNHQAFTNTRPHNRTRYVCPSSGWPCELGRNSLRWKCWLGDAAPAFLQPDSERQLPLYMADHEIHLSISLPFGKPISISLREYSWASQCTALVVSRSHRPAP